jgi:hypothetical protein
MQTIYYYPHAEKRKTSDIAAKGIPVLRHIFYV